MKYIVDIQGFVAPYNITATDKSFKNPKNKFILKELSIIKVESSSSSSLWSTLLPSSTQYIRNDVENFLFAPPYPWQCLPEKFKNANHWVVCNLHGIPWEAGDIAYNQLHNILNSKLQNATYIFVKGLEKKEWFKRNLRLSPNIINLEDIGCPSLKNLRVSACVFFNYHRRVKREHHHCATENVRKLKIWFWEKFSDIPSFKRSLMLLHHSYSAKNLDKEDIAVLPQDFIIKYLSKDIESIWDKLPVSYQLNNEIASCRQCQEHWSSDLDEYDNIDGHPPMKKECILCINK